MAIEMHSSTDNGIVGSYYRILKSEELMSPGEPVPRTRMLVGFYFSADLRDSKPDAPMFVHEFNFPFTGPGSVACLPDPRPNQYEALMQHEFFANTNATPHL